MNPISKHRDILRKKIHFEKHLPKPGVSSDDELSVEATHMSSLAEETEKSPSIERQTRSSSSTTNSTTSNTVASAKKTSSITREEEGISDVGSLHFSQDESSEDEPDSDEEALAQFVEKRSKTKSKTPTTSQKTPSVSKSSSRSKKESVSSEGSDIGSIQFAQDSNTQSPASHADVAITTKEATTTPTSYTYPIQYNSTNERINRIEDRTKIYICPYRVNNYASTPFVQYCLYKYPKSDNQSVNDLMIFMYIRYKKSAGNPIEQTNAFVKNTFLVNKNYEGIIEYNGNFYVFYNFSDFEQEGLDELEKNRSDTWWWCLIDEIVNYKRVINFPIFEEHSRLFLENPSLLYLYNGEKQKIEIPVVGFHGTYYDYKILILTQGLRKSTLYAMVGPYYYFGTFRKAVRYAGWTSTYKMREVDGVAISDDEGRYNRGAIIRFAVFVGEMNALLNHPDERDDMSGLVKQRLKENPKSQFWEKLTLKMHDHEGKWTEYYDSLYIGKAKLSNSKRFMANPEFIVKKYKQQYVLSAHELDKSTLEKNWNNSKQDYNIL